MLNATQEPSLTTRGRGTQNLLHFSGWATRLRLFFAAPSELAELLGQVETFRKEEQARLRHYDDTRKWLDDAQARNPRLPIWKLVLEYGVLQSECRVRWAERALAFMTNRNRRKKQ
jgi:hypothetical protein